MEEEEVMVKEMRTERYSVKVMEDGYVHLYGNAPYSESVMQSSFPEPDTISGFHLPADERHVRADV